MAIVAVMEFDWDDGNRDKNLRHGVHDSEIEGAFQDTHGFVASQLTVGGEARYILFGRAAGSGKYLRVVFAVRMREGSRLIRPISAVEMSERNKRRYRRRR